MTAATTTGLSPFAKASYTSQENNALNAFNFGTQQNADQSALSGVTWADKINQLQQTLGQQRSMFPDKFASRGLLNSGVYNYGSQAGETGGLGALQQFQQNASEQLNTANMQSANVQNQYTHQQQQLQTGYNTTMGNLGGIEAGDAANQAINNTIAGA